MPSAPKILAQSTPTAASLTTLYTCPASTKTIVSSLVICNTSSTATSFRLSFSIDAAADALKQYLYYDEPIFGNHTFIATIGATLDASDLIRVYATLATLSFTAFGTELT